MQKSDQRVDVRQLLAPSSLCRKLNEDSFSIFLDERDRNPTLLAILPCASFLAAKHDECGWP